MKKLFFLYALVALSSCSYIDSNRIAPGYTQAFSLINSALFGEENTAITPELIENIPYASLLVKIGNGPYGLMILESISGDETTWVSGDGVYFVIRDGRIIRSRGLENNLFNTILPYTFTSKEYLKKPTDQEINFYYSFDKPFLANLGIQASYTFGNTSSFQLLTQMIELKVIEEQLSNDEILWKPINKYWIDQTGFIWKSEQHISPKIPKIYIEVTKKPS